MLTNRIVGTDWAERSFRLLQVLSRIIVTALLSCYPALVHAQSSPLTVQPSTGRVGVGVTSPQYPLDVTGTVNATSFRGDGSQLTNLPGGGGGGGTGGYGSRGQFSRNSTGAPDSQYDLKADVVILSKPSGKIKGKIKGVNKIQNKRGQV